MEIIVKLLVYSIIMTIVSFTISKLHKESKGGELYFDQKIVSGIYFVVAICFSILFIFVGSFPSNVEGITKTILSIAAIIFNLLLYFISYIYYVRFIKFENDRIIYKSGLSRLKTLMYKDITIAKKDENGNLLLYVDKEMVLKLHKELCASGVLREHKVPFEQINEQSFTMKVTNLYRGLMAVCCIVFLAFMILCICTNYLIGIVIFGIMLIVSFVECLNQFKKKFIVSKDEIVAISLFNNKKITISNIVRVERKNVDNANVLYLYSKEGLETKISMLYSNSYLLEKMLKNKIQDK